MTLEEMYNAIITEEMDNICRNTEGTNVFFKFDDVVYLFVDCSDVEGEIEMANPELKRSRVIIPRFKDMNVLLSRYNSLYENLDEDERFKFNCFIIPEFMLNMDLDSYKLWRKLK